MPIVSCENLTLGYEGKTLVSNLSFSVKPGDYLAVVGENGSGKSSLMKTLVRLQAPVSGRVTLGEGLLPLDMGYLPQETAERMDFPASVWEIVISGCLNRRGLRPYYNRKEKLAAEDHMERLGVASLARKCYRDLSGGLKRRVLLARALGAASRLLLLDEPVAGLDPKAAEDLYALIQNLNASGLTIIMISHDIPSSLRYASHILHIGRGRALYFGTVNDYAKSEAGRSLAGGGA